MSSLTIGIFVVVALLALMAAGVPIVFALGLTALFTVLVFLGPDESAFFGEFVFNSVDSFTLLAIPLFIFMGTVFGRSQASADLFEAARILLKWLRGGLAMTSVVACALFSALCGSSIPTVAAIGRVAIPEMRKRGYSAAVSTGAVVGGGTLGILIPPSITLIVYGIAAEQSIGQLFVGGIVPGVVLVVLFCLWISLAMRLDSRGSRRVAVDANGGGSAGGNQVLIETLEVERVYWADRVKIVLKVFPFLAILIGVLSALYLGLATPSEAAAAGAFLALVVVIATYRSMTWKKFHSILLESAGESTMVMLIVAFAAVLGSVMSLLGIPQELALLITELESSKWLVLLAINVVLLLLGLFLPPVSIILMVTPVLLPIITALQFDLIWFGVIMTVNMEMGLITPPMGVNLYVVKGIAPDIPLRDILVGSIPYVIILGLSIILFSAAPGLITWLPNALFAH